MKPKDAKKLLGCSYTTLHNYVKAGKIQLINTESKQQIYDDQSVFKLYNQIKVIPEKLNNTIHIFVNNQKFEFKLNKHMINKIFNILYSEFNKELVS